MVARGCMLAAAVGLTACAGRPPGTAAPEPSTVAPPAAKDRMVIADFDAVVPVNLFGWDHTAVVAANPVPSAANPGGHVAGWDKSAGTWKGMGFFIREPIDFATYPRYTFRIWYPVAGRLVIKFFHGEDEGTKFERDVEPITRVREWQAISVDLPALKPGYYTKVEVVPVPDAPGAIGPFYFDDFILYPGK